jgi:septal ring factor EnvC (AmiA/AmiB activator)
MLTEFCLKVRVIRCMYTGVMWSTYSVVGPPPILNVGEVQVVRLREQLEEAQKDLTAAGQTAEEVAKLQATVAMLTERVRCLELESKAHEDALKKKDEDLQEARHALAEKDAEIAALKCQAAAVLTGRVTPTLPLISAPSIAGSARSGSRFKLNRWAGI